MTEHLTPEEFDELASAYLDSELDATSAARVENDPELLARVEELADVQHKVSATPVVAPALRTEHLATALAAFDQIHADTPPVGQVGAPPTVTSLAEQRDSRSRRINRSSQRRNGMPGWLSAAAASVAVLGGVAVYTNQQQSTTDEMSAESGDSTDAESSDGSGSFSIQDSQSEMMQDADGAMSSFADDADESSAIAGAASNASEDATSDAMGEDASSTETTIEALGSVAPAADDASAEESDESQESEPDLEILERDEVTLFYPTATPAETILDDLELLNNDVSNSNCAALASSAVSPAGDPLEFVIGYYPVDLGGVATEILIYGPATASLVDAATCQLLQ